jgi:hypothetical protein
MHLMQEFAAQLYVALRPAAHIDRDEHALHYANEVSRKIAKAQRLDAAPANESDSLRLRAFA